MFITAVCVIFLIMIKLAHPSLQKVLVDNNFPAPPPPLDIFNLD